jgi:hypothetical protein
MAEDEFPQMPEYVSEAKEELSQARAAEPGYRPDTFGLRAFAADVPTPDGKAWPTAGVTLSNAAEVVRYHTPTAGQILAAHEALAVAAEAHIRVILTYCHACADRTDAIRKVREAKMTASAAVALSGLV